ncbi:Basic-leucine zipper domain [Macleaya cordata]|uniref:Basic-leucine zipper domain n=1 Tax=Macleaya cordata TaxID=56857 RepID=A0A200Q3R3_MACCD|nr:Basic-leucine zipper domain [Macleaya cordata]
MGNEEAQTPVKSEKSSSSPAPEQINVPVYPDWAAIQAYYGAGVPIPPPYFNSAVTPGHPPHPYMWGPPQHLMPPYGTPYAAIYSHGGIYAHPSVSLGSHGHGIPSSPAVPEALVATPLSIATPVKSPSSKDIGTKIKGSDGSAAGSQSAECGTSSSNGSEGSTEGGNQVLGKRSSRDKLSIGKPVGTVPSHSIHPALELRNSAHGMISAATVAPAPGAAVLARDGLPSEHCAQDERELKRQKRKQSNRESARRSRLRKQAESEELALKVESLNVENLALRSELNQLAEDSEKLKLENAALTEKLKNAQLGQAKEIVSNEIEAVQGAAASMSTENFLSMVNNSGSLTLHPHQDSDAHENSNSGTKLHQLLESSPRADAVAAG